MPDPVIDDEVVPDIVAPPLSLRPTVHVSVVNADAESYMLTVMVSEKYAEGDAVLAETVIEFIAAVPVIVNDVDWPSV